MAPRPAQWARHFRSSRWSAASGRGAGSADAVARRGHVNVNAAEKRAAQTQGTRFPAFAKSIDFGAIYLRHRA